MSTADRILVVGPSWVGDMVLSQSLYKSLKRRNSAIEIHVAAPTWSRGLLHRVPEVDEMIDWPFRHGELNLKARYQLGVELRHQGYTQAIVLPGSAKAALIPWFASIPVRTGYRGEMRYGLLNDMRRLDKQSLPKTIDRFVYLGQARGTKPNEVKVEHPALTVSIPHQAQCLEHLGLDTIKPVLTLLPGASFGQSKQWPPAHFAELADHYLKQGFQVWIFGSHADRAASQQITRRLKQTEAVFDLCGKTTLEDVIDLLPLSKLVVTNDSGLMHVAAAVGCSAIVMYGGTSPVMTPPMTEQAAIIYHDISCSPCWDRECRYGHYRCLTEITPAEVTREAENLLAKM